MVHRDIVDNYSGGYLACTEALLDESSIVGLAVVGPWKQYKNAT